jgi:hypothetical protein
LSVASLFSGDAFMALALMPNALKGDAGLVTCPPAFGIPS